MLSDQAMAELAELPQGRDLLSYVERGVPTNHFLSALLANELMECIGRADPRNLAALPAYCTWLRSHAPALCYGSRARAAAWIAHKGLSGVM